MSGMKDLDYDIQELFIEGYSPVSIAAMLNCPIETVYDWLDTNNVAEKQQDDFDPFNTVNS